ncbi:MAG: helix-turn-helix domain-containing protein [Acidobacteriota bacterium]|nr:helix-turn-helix domain-containing protein [Acidobacteriota bacterium]MDQ5837930.1 helix-turn-helix domain-containing protein [Acidobacteriota bacterium]
MKKYHVELTDDERAELRKLIRRGRRVHQTSTRKVTRARILLLADAGASDTAIVAATHVSLKTVVQLRRRFVEAGLGALNERPRTGRPPGRGRTNRKILPQPINDD